MPSDSGQIENTEPTQDSVKLTKLEQESLIILRNNLEWSQKFDKAQKDAHKTKQLWSELALEINQGVTGTQIREKYNYLLKTYRQLKLNSKQTGAAPIKWYFYKNLYCDCEIIMV